jgi:hypothetical protein
MNYEPQFSCTELRKMERALGELGTREEGG